MMSVSEFRALQLLAARRGLPPSNGHHPMQPGELADGQIAPSSYLRLLPSIYAEDDFAGRFLRIFEDVLDPISVMVDNQPYYFDPLVAPPALLDWLAVWVDLSEGDNWPLRRRRALVAAAAALYRMRGTAAGLKRHVSLFTGAPTLLMERTTGFRLSADALLGLNTTIGDDRLHTFTVTVLARDPESLDLETVRAIIDAGKPVETTYVLRVARLAPARRPTERS